MPLRRQHIPVQTLKRGSKNKLFNHISRYLHCRCSGLHVVATMEQEARDGRSNSIGKPRTTIRTVDLCMKTVCQTDILHYFLKVNSTQQLLLWLHYRCQERIERGVNVEVNTDRLTILQNMLDEVEEGLRGDRYNNLRDSCIAMPDLTDDENSPRHGVSDQQLHLEWERSRIDYEYALERRKRMRRYRHCTWKKLQMLSCGWRCITRMELTEIPLMFLRENDSTMLTCLELTWSPRGYTQRMNSEKAQRGLTWSLVHKWESLVSQWSDILLLKWISTKGGLAELVVLLLKVETLRRELSEYHLSSGGVCRCFSATSP